ncbi:alpha-L-rhamnosidase, partial [Streptomyces sp. 2MCAF27]
MQVTTPVFEHHREPLGIGEPEPRLSWRTATDAEGWQQTAYEVRVCAEDGTELAAPGRVESAESVLVPWPGPALRSRQRVAVRVRVWGTGGDEPSAWSEPAHAETGLLRPEDWTARPITSGRSQADGPHPADLLRREFTVRGPVTAARLYITACGVY